MSGSFGQFKIYPRGFLGAILEPILLKSPTRTTRLNYDMTVFDPKEEKTVTANIEIDSLFAQLVRRDVLSDDFDFREKALSKILQAFGTMDFKAWYLAQFQSPSFGILHRNFLDDCIHFIQSGTRKLPIQNWDAILSATEKRELDRDILLTERTQNFFSYENGQGQVKYLSDLRITGQPQLTRVIQDWLSKPTGFTDLLYSSHILFGNA